MYTADVTASNAGGKRALRPRVPEHECLPVNSASRHCCGVAGALGLHPRRMLKCMVNDSLSEEQ